VVEHALGQNQVRLLPGSGEGHRDPVEIEAFPGAVGNDGERIFPDGLEQGVFRHVRLVQEIGAGQGGIQDGIVVAVPDGGGIEVKAGLHGQDHPMPEAQQRPDGQQVEEHPARGVGQKKNLERSAAPGIEQGRQPAEPLRQGSHVAFQPGGVRPPVLAFPDGRHGAEHEQPGQLQAVQAEALFGDAADLGCGGSGVEHGLEPRILNAGESPAIMEPLAFPVRVVQPGLGEKDGAQPFGQAGRDDGGVDQGLPVLEFAQGAYLGPGVGIGHARVDEPIHPVELDGIFVQDHRVGLAAGKTNEHRVGAGDVNLLRRQGHHEPELFRRGILRIDGMLQVVLGHEMEQPGVEDRILAVAPDAAGGRGHGGRDVGHGRLMNPLSRSFSK